MICDKCLHADVCGAEGVYEEALTYCANFLGWIPVSEKLPEDSGEYLVSVIDEEDEEYKRVGVAWFAHPKNYDIKDGEWRELMIREKVIAWMPLPKAYGEVVEDADKENPKSCSTCRSYKGHAGHCEICHEMSMYKAKSEDKE